MIEESQAQTPETAARRWGDWPGYTLATYSQVGLPVYRLTLTAVTIERKSLDVILEFILRAVATGLRSEPEIGSFLGLGQDLIKTQVADLLREGLLTLGRPLNHGEARPLLLSKQGEGVFKSGMSTRPTDLTVIAHFDGLLRKPRAIALHDLWKPRDLKAMAVPEIALSRGQRPTADEIDPVELERSLTEGRNRTRREHGVKILRITSVERAESWYRPAVLLIFRAQHGSELRLRVVVDGRLSESHAAALLEAGTIEKNPLFQQLGQPEPAPSNLAEVVGPRLADAVSRGMAPGRTDAEVEGHESPEPSLGTVDIAGFAEVRPLSVFEHAELLDRAFTDSKRRVVIVSPWIRAAVANQAFFRKLTACLKRGVKVIIGHGFGEDRHSSFEDQRAMQRLEDLQKEGLVIRRLGDSHAKVLIVDSEFYVISSFNWLSFRGDRNSAFREEWGVLIKGSDAVEELIGRLAPRLKEAAD